MIVNFYMRGKVFRKDVINNYTRSILVKRLVALGFLLLNFIQIGKTIKLPINKYLIVI